MKGRTFDYTESPGNVSDNFAIYTKATILYKDLYFFLLLFVVPVIIALCYCRIARQCSRHLEDTAVEASSLPQDDDNRQSIYIREFSDEPPLYEDVCHVTPPPLYDLVKDDYPLPRYRDVVVTADFDSGSQTDRV